MVDESTRVIILRLRAEGHGSRQIARALGLARNTVRMVLKSGKREVPPLVREERGAALRDEILSLHAALKGNLVRVHEELRAAGATLSYQALTAFCRRHGIGVEKPKPAGQYLFAPGQEMQHDTSPHDAVIGGRSRRVQTASLVLCYSRMMFIQLYPRFTRFECKVFLTDAVRYFGGACASCMIDNTHVVVLRGTGALMVPVPEMVGFGERLGFSFAAHEKGDANRSARVERPFDYIENNFLARTEGFTDWDHANREAVAWCDKVNAAQRRHLHASARELFAVERTHLRPLPIWVPDVYALHQRMVDLEGYVSLHSNRYSVPYELIARRVEVRETKDRVIICDGRRQVAEHHRVREPLDTRITCPEHRPRRGKRPPTEDVLPEERALLAAVPEVAAYVEALKKRSAGRGTVAVRRLARLCDEYPRAPLIESVHTAARYGLYDLDRLERMVLRRIAGDYFVVPPHEPINDDDTDDEDPEDDPDDR